MDAQKALEIEKARKEDKLKVKFRKVGKSTVVTVPSIIMESENIRNLVQFGLTPASVFSTIG